MVENLVGCGRTAGEVADIFKDRFIIPELVNPQLLITG
jgi:hypothetical protein